MKNLPGSAEYKEMKKALAAHDEISNRYTREYQLARQREARTGEDASQATAELFEQMETAYQTAFAARVAFAAIYTASPENVQREWKKRDGRGVNMAEVAWICR